MIKGAYKKNDGYSGLNRNTTSKEGKTVKCERCASYAALELSIVMTEKGKTLYFCSKECKEAFLSGK
jgi:hypothetical protein